MGRWGWRLFEGDQDLDAACCLAESLGIQTDDWEHSMSSMVHQTDMLADEGTRAFYRTEEYKRELENEIVPYVRANFDTDNFGDSCFQCGQVTSDIGHGLVLCTKCSVAYYCDGECERHHWQEHKASCVRPEERRSRNV
ncbi:hypothetical protein COH20_010922 [Aspergillus flavus]|nr:hypothetical protein COH20_010922 [Aspergillus flavus]RAQ63060.1 hypothetical protein COH21_009762 [Aspergillus flavus]